MITILGNRIMPSGFMVGVTIQQQYVNFCLITQYKLTLPSPRYVFGCVHKVKLKVRQGIDCPLGKAHNQHTNSEVIEGSG